MVFERIGIIGLGNMGLSMATHLMTHQGLQVAGHDISELALERAKSHGVHLMGDLGELVAWSQVLVLSLPKAEHVTQICLGKGGISAHAKKELIIIDTSTSTPKVSRQIHEVFQGQQMIFMDAPVSGGPKGAASGTMSMMVGADDEAYQNVLPLLQKMSAKQVHIGQVGAGNVVKIANNLLVATNLITTAEMVSLAHHAGVSPQDFIRGLNQGSGKSAVSEVNFPTWILSEAYDSGFSMGLMRKDVTLAKQMMCELGLDLPVTSGVTHIWQQSIHELSDGQDFNEIVKLMSDVFKDNSKVDEEL